MNNIYAVIMAGGSGERFWPKSRRALPKQLLAIVSERSMIEETIARLKELIPKDKIIIVTNKLQKELIKQKTGCKNIIAEPVSKNTAPCIAVSAMFMDPDAVMFVLPADQHIKDVRRFKETLIKASGIASKEDVLVTLGIKPRFPHTGFGYIEKGKRLGGGLFKIKRFTEKPNLKIAKKYCKSGRFLWNSGMFIWKAGTILEEIKKYLPKLSGLCEKENINNIYKKAENISIDYGVMEKTDRAVVLEAGFVWDDVGNWASLDKHCKKDKNKNVTQGKVVVKDVNNSIIVTDSPLISAIGVSNLIIVGTRDAVLVCPKNKAEEVKDIVGMLKKGRRYKKYL